MNKISTSESSSRLAVTYRPVGELIPDPCNARTHPKRQIDQMVRRIEATLDGISDHQELLAGLRALVRMVRSEPI